LPLRLPCLVSLSSLYTPLSVLYSLSLHDALPICDVLTGGGAHTLLAGEVNVFGHDGDVRLPVAAAILASAGLDGVDAGEDAVLRSEEHTSELQSRFDLVCRLLLAKKTRKTTKTRR